jgi:hypothetical protein
MRRAHAATVLAVVMIVAGFALLALGWRGAAALLFVPGQVAYTLSGGFVGFALIGAGLAILNVQVSRVLTAGRTYRFNALVADTVAALATIRESDVPAVVAARDGVPAAPSTERAGGVAVAPAPTVTRETPADDDTRWRPA